MSPSIPTTADIKAEVKRLTGDGVDLAIEAAGSPQTLAQTIQVTRPRGSVVCGGNQPLDASLPMSFIEDMMRKELRLNGCFMSYSAPFPGHEWTESVERSSAAGLRMDTMISHRFPLSQAVHVFEDIAADRLHRKIILLPESRHDPREPLPGWSTRSANISRSVPLTRTRWSRYKPLSPRPRRSAPPRFQVSHRAALARRERQCDPRLTVYGVDGHVAAASVAVPVALHLDHATVTEVTQAIGLGFTSVMFDGGDLPIEENIRVTRVLGARALPGR